ncbi:hypothetical protein FRC05_003536 [Tulasnella sp. 425]|nr:hypothetical protein FRC05_003536 [Tulasnella sp. 425]
MEASSSPASMREVLSIPLAQFEALTNQLFASLATVPPTAAAYSFSNSLTAPDVESFVHCEVALAEALNQARLHQIKQRRIEQLKEDIVALDWRLNDICEKLKEDKSALEEIIREAEVRVKAIDRTEKAYAQNLTNHTSAPLMDTNPSPDQMAPPAFRPPYPDDAILRLGSLGRSGARLTEPVGEARIVGEPAPSPLGPARAPAPSAADTKRHPGHYRPPPAVIPDFGLDLSDD